jgi:hypothetical protein
MKERLDTADDRASRATYLVNSGNALHNRFMRTELIDVLDRAITVGEDAVAPSLLEHHTPDRAAALNDSH